MAAHLIDPGFEGRPYKPSVGAETSLEKPEDLMGVGNRNSKSVSQQIDVARVYLKSDLLDDRHPLSDYHILLEQGDKII
jgi:hypothetical protein